MTLPVVVFADPQDGTIDYLEAALAALPDLPAYVLDDDGSPITISSSFPDGETGSPVVPHWQVRYDVTPSVLYPVLERATLGLVTWYPPGRKSDARDAAALGLGLLAACPGTDSIRTIAVLTGRTPGVDADTGLYFVTSTFRVSTRPAQL